jgi:hypothetical protein
MILDKLFWLCVFALGLYCTIAGIVLEEFQQEDNDDIQ